MSTSMVPMIAPDGAYGEVPQERLQDAVAAGGKVGIWFKAPDGTTGVIPRENVPAAVKAGGTPYGSFAALQQAQQLDSKAPQPTGFLSAIGQDLKAALMPQASAFQGSPLHWSPGVNTSGAEAAASQQQQSFAAADRARAAAGYSAPYRVTAGIATAATPLNVQGMEQAAAQGDTAGVLGHAATATAATVAPLAVEGVVKGAGNLMREASTSSIRATVPEAAHLPSNAIVGAERVFRAAAPVGSDPEFRSNLYAAAGDLAEIGRNIDIAEARGGVIQPDRRVAATVDAINSHLSDMFQNELAPQIARNADVQLVPKLSADAQAGLDFLSRNAGTAADRALASDAMQSGSISLAQADALDRAASRELAPLRGMTPQELAVSEGNSQRFAGLQALDKEIGDAINKELEGRGEPGIDSYKRRYAGLSAVRDQLQARINAVELQRKNIGSIVRAIRGGTAGIASASQAAVADVNIGRQLQIGLRQLADSGIEANRPTGTGARPVRGLLGTGATQLGPSSEALNPTTPFPPTGIADTATRQRLGLTQSAPGTGTGYPTDLLRALQNH